MTETSLPAPASDQRFAGRLLLWVAVFTNLLVVVSWPLWFCPLQPKWSAEHGDFPQVPLFAFAAGTPRLVDWALVGLLLVASWVFGVSNKKRLQQVSLIVYLACGAALICLDQHRLQPWLYQFMLTCLFALCLREQRIPSFTRLLFISIYLFSAWSKLDYLFAHTLGQQFLDAVAKLMGLTLKHLNEQTRANLALVFPLAEALFAFGLCLRKTKQFAAWLMILLHVGLLLILGPLGLGHSNGVLLWNVFSAVMVWQLFLSESPAPEMVKSSEPQAPYWTAGLGVAVLLLPLLEPLGFLDHWPAWQLYAPRNSRVSLMFTDEAVERIPSNLRKYVKQDASTPWAYFDLDAWSLASRHVPNYPQDRFQLGLALAISSESQLQGATKIAVSGVSDRFSGRRTKKILWGVDEARDYAASYTLNCGLHRPFRSVNRLEQND